MRGLIRFGGAAALTIGAVMLPGLAGASSSGTVPSAPTAVTAAQTILSPSVTVSWATPASDGGQPIKGYTATVMPGNLTCSPKPKTATTCTVLVGAIGVYTASVVATNKNGNSVPGVASSSVTTKAHALYNAPVLAMNDPDDIAYDGTNVWTVSYTSSSFTAMTTSGALVLTSPAGTQLTEYKGADAASYTGVDPIVGAAVSDGSRVIGVDSTGGTVAISVTSASKSASYLGSHNPIVGQSVTGSSVPVGTTVKSVDRSGHSLVLSAKATATSSNQGGAKQVVPKNVLLSVVAKKAATVSAAPYGLNAPFGIVKVPGSSSLFISNSGGGADGYGSITQIDTSGNFIRSFSNSDGAFGFFTPAFLATDGNHVWVTNSGPEVYNGYNGHTVTEINAADGTLSKVLDAGYKFAGPTGIKVIGSNVWVANYTGGPDGNGSVTVFDKSTDAVVGVFSNTAGSGYTNANYKFGQAYAFAVDGSGNVWVANGSGTNDTSCGQAEGCGSITEMTPSGGLVANYHSLSYGLNDPAGIAYDGNGHIWVSNYGPVTATSAGGGRSVFEINASDGSLVQKLSDASFGICTPNTLQYFAEAMWMPNGCSNAARMSGPGGVTKIIP